MKLSAVVDLRNKIAVSLLRRSEDRESATARNKCPATALSG
jgi:hypothetical protein